MPETTTAVHASQLGCARFRPCGESFVGPVEAGQPGCPQPCIVGVALYLAERDRRLGEPAIS